MYLSVFGKGSKEITDGKSVLDGHCGLSDAILSGDTERSLRQDSTNKRPLTEPRRTVGLGVKIEHNAGVMYG